MRRALLVIAIVLGLSLLAFASLTLSNGLKIDNSGKLLISMAGGAPNIVTSQGFPLDSSGNLLVDCATGCSTGSGNLSGTWTSTGNVVTTEGTGTAQDSGTALTALAPATSIAPDTNSVPWMTSRASGAVNFSTGSNKAIFAGAVLLFPKTTTQVSYFVGSTADNTSDNYDIGVYSGTSGGACTLQAHIGPTAGTTFAPAANGWHTLSRASSTTLQPGRYYLAYTTNAVTPATIYGDSGTLTFAGSSGGANSNVSVTPGGTLPASATCPTDSYTTTMPAFAIN